MLYVTGLVLAIVVLTMVNTPDTTTPVERDEHLARDEAPHQFAL